MTDRAKIDDELFGGGPLLRWERSLGLAKGSRPSAALRCGLAILVAWVPLAILATAQFLIWGDESAKTFFSDFAVDARFLMAAPALIYAEQECIPRLGRIVNHFAESGLVIEADRARFAQAVSSTQRLLASTIGDLVMLLLVYLGVTALALYFSTAAVMPWHQRTLTGAFHLSLAGWWHVLVSLPLLLILLLSWLWRLALWSRFLFLMSRLDLHLIAGHPDGVGGLRFVATSLRGLRFISFALGAIVAGSIANRQFHQGTEPLSFKNLVIGLMVFLVVLFAGPMTIFLKKLRETKRRGTFEYGGLARAVGIQFEAKWLRPGKLDESSLHAPDFSATTDLYSVVNNVYSMREVPFTLRDLIGPIGVSAMLPFIPLALMAIPLEVILRGVVKLLF